jgi:hypothetical protein
MHFTDDANVWGKKLSRWFLLVPVRLNFFVLLTNTASVMKRNLPDLPGSFDSNRVNPPTTGKKL